MCRSIFSGGLSSKFPRWSWSSKVAEPNGRLLVTARPEYVGQILATLAVSLGPFAAGLGKGYSSPAIASLQQNQAEAFPVTKQQISWLASLSLLGALFGAPLGGIAVRWGRRRTLVLASIPLSLCWITTMFARHVGVLCVAAFLSGVLVAVVQLSAQVYISEISASNVRGGLSAVLKIAGHVGVLVSFTAGAFLDWRQLAALISVVPATMCVVMLKVRRSKVFERSHNIDIQTIFQGFNSKSQVICKVCIPKMDWVRMIWCVIIIFPTWRCQKVPDGWCCAVVTKKRSSPWGGFVVETPICAQN